MQRFAVALTLASIAVALNLNDEDDVLGDPLDVVDAPELDATVDRYERGRSL